MFEAILSIDLGASYTKVAYRNTCAPPKGEQKEPAQVLFFDGSPLIPSLTIRTRNPAQPWVFGRLAAGMTPSVEMQVFQNWKADLFRPRNDQDSATAAIIVHRFFEWLRSRLEKDHSIDVRKCQTRVAMPAFDTFDENAVLVARCMDLSGWDDPTLILKVREPHANTLGLFTEGRNIVMCGAQGQRSPNYAKIFGPDNVLIRRAREHVLYGTHTNLLTVMVVDIGAFTTDLALLTFDVTAPADGLSAIRQESHALGVINQLDSPLFAAIGERHGFSWSALRFEDAELYKRELYQGNAPALQIQGGPIIQLGDETDIKLFQEAAQQFAAGVWGKVTAFITTPVPSHVLLTGGGSLIRPVADRLKASFKGGGVRVVPVPEANGEAGTGERRRWQDTGEGLQRLATAVGGASVILQEAAFQEPHAFPPEPRSPSGSAFMNGRKNCRCQGGNKDCCFCGGRGFVSV
jgi:hypothetical protein